MSDKNKERMKIIGARIHTVLILPVALVLTVLIYVLRPFVTVRLGHCGVCRLGGFYLPLYCMYLDAHQRPKKPHYDIFYYLITPVSNYAFMAMFKRKGVRFFSYRRLAHVVHQLLCRLPGGARHILDYRIPLVREVAESIYAASGPMLSFSDEEEKRGQAGLRKAGVPEGKEFICFYSRDTAYLQRHFQQTDWTYHDYRNTSITSYLPAAEYLVKKGYYTVRMGSVVEEKLDIDNPAVIDYATNGTRSEFMDIYLSAKCKYFLGSDSGIMLLAEVFRKPIIYANWVSIGFLPEYQHSGIILLKKWYSSVKGRFLTFEEIFPRAYPQKVNTEGLGIKLFDNSTEEMVEAIEEMEARLNGTWVETDEDRLLQKKFWDLYGKGKDRSVSSQMKIGAKFLRRNKDLFKSLQNTSAPVAN